MSPQLALFRVRDRVTGPASPFSPVERLVAICIADHANGQGAAWPSLPRIAGWTGLGVTAVRAAIARLCSGPDPVFLRSAGGARPGARYEPTRYTLAAPEGAREARGSSGDVEGIATRAQGYRHAYQKDPTKGPTNDPTKGRLSPRDTLDGLADQLTGATSHPTLRAVRGRTR